MCVKLKKVKRSKFFFDPTKYDWRNRLFKNIYIKRAFTKGNIQKKRFLIGIPSHTTGNHRFRKKSKWKGGEAYRLGAMFLLL